MKKLKIGVDIGHNCRCNGGAVSGKIKEDTLTMEVGTEVIKLCKQLGHEVIETLPKTAKSQADALKQRVQKANDHDVDLFVSIHFNKTKGGYGTEVFIFNVKDAATKTTAERICKNFNGLGYKNRGVKDGSELYVIEHTNAAAYLVECCFIDSADDMKRYDKHKMAKAIVEGVLNTKITAQDPPGQVDNIPNGEIQRKAIVTADTLNVRSGRGTQYPVLGKLKKGDVVELWYKIDKWTSMEKKFKGSRGEDLNNFINMDYVKLI